MKKIILISIILIIAVVLVLLLIIYRPTQDQDNFWLAIKESCESSGGIYIGGPPTGWMDNREIWIPCQCPENTRWSFSPDFKCVNNN